MNVNDLNRSVHVWKESTAFMKLMVVGLELHHPPFDAVSEALDDAVGTIPWTAQTEVPTLHRLATKTDFFTARVSACVRDPVARS